MHLCLDTANRVLRLLLDPDSSDARELLRFGLPTALGSLYLNAIEDRDADGTLPSATTLRRLLQCIESPDYLNTLPEDAYPEEREVGEQIMRALCRNEESNLGHARLRASATVLSLVANRNVCGSQIDLLTGLALRLCLSDVSEGKGLPKASDLAYRLCNALPVDDAEKEAIAEEGADVLEEIAGYLNDSES